MVLIQVRTQRGSVMHQYKVFSHFILLALGETNGLFKLAVCVLNIYVRRITDELWQSCIDLMTKMHYLTEKRIYIL